MEGGREEEEEEGMKVHGAVFIVERYVLVCSFLCYYQVASKSSFTGLLFTLAVSHRDYVLYFVIAF